MHNEKSKKLLKSPGSHMGDQLKKTENSKHTGVDSFKVNNDFMKCNLVHFDNVSPKISTSGIAITAQRHLLVHLERKER